MAWGGAFLMDRMKIRGVPPIPGARSFPALSLRTYVRDQRTGVPGMYFFSLDVSSLLAVGVGKVFYHMPFHWAQMRLEQKSDREFSFYGRRLLSSWPVAFRARYKGLGTDAQAGGEPQRDAGEFFDGALLPVCPQPGGPDDPGQPTSCPVAAGRGRGGDRAERSGRVDRNLFAQREAGAVLLQTAGGLYMAGRAGAADADGAAGNSGGFAVGLDRLRKIGQIEGEFFGGPSAGARAKLESLWPGEFRARSPLPDGRVDFGVVLSGYTNSGFAIKPTLI